MEKEKEEERTNSLLDKINKLSLPFVILISSIVLGSFYYASQVNKQKSTEKQQQIEIEQEKQDQLDKELKEQRAKEEADRAKEEADQALNSCIDEAEETYSDNWYRECKGLGRLTDRCILLHDMTFDEYAEQNNIPSVTENAEKRLEAITDFYDEKDECSCRLPGYLADSVDSYRDKLKDECFKKYPQ